MKTKSKIFIGCAAVAVAAVAAVNVTMSNTNKVLKVSLKVIEVNAQSESNGMHGRPLLRNTSTGEFKCDNCSGNDCGAIC